ncbi:MAG: rhomboid family intramembrane serine protease [Planctomycetota bacterium]|jgi:membrane associated rhomboid family serine protease
MIIPIKTDAVQYYHPFGTLGAILANIVIFSLTGPVAREEFWILQYGTVLPWQWITSAFGHADLGHLFWNMVFLWFFGQIVEGRLGWLRFLAIYLGMAAAEGLITQTIMLGSGPAKPGYGALGASGVIYGLMVIACFWSPRDHITCVFMLFFLIPFLRLFQCRVKTFALVYVGLDLTFVLLFGFEMGTSLLHVLGALVGLVPAVLLHRTGWVYLGDWNGLLSPPPFRMLEPDEAERPAPRARPEAASPPRPDPPRPVPAGPAPPRTDRERLDRAEGLVARERPRKALEVLARIELGRLSLVERTRLDEIEARARKQIDDGVIELGG